MVRKQKIGETQAEYKEIISKANAKSYQKKKTRKAEENNAQQQNMLQRRTQYKLQQTQTGRHRCSPSDSDRVRKENTGLRTENTVLRAENERLRTRLRNLQSTINTEINDLFDPPLRSV